MAADLDYKMNIQDIKPLDYFIPKEFKCIFELLIKYKDDKSTESYNDADLYEKLKVKLTNHNYEYKINTYTEFRKCSVGNPFDDNNHTKIIKIMNLMIINRIINDDSINLDMIVNYLCCLRMHKIFFICYINNFNTIERLFKILLINKTDIIPVLKNKNEVQNLFNIFYRDICDHQNNQISIDILIGELKKIIFLNEDYDIYSFEPNTNMIPNSFNSFKYELNNREDKREEKEIIRLYIKSNYEKFHRINTEIENILNELQRKYRKFMNILTSPMNISDLFKFIELYKCLSIYEIGIFFDRGKIEKKVFDLFQEIPEFNEFKDEIQKKPKMHLISMNILELKNRIYNIYADTNSKKNLEMNFKDLKIIRSLYDILMKNIDELYEITQFDKLNKELFNDKIDKLLESKYKTNILEHPIDKLCIYCKTTNIFNKQSDYNNIITYLLQVLIFIYIIVSMFCNIISVYSLISKIYPQISEYDWIFEYNDLVIYNIMKFIYLPYIFLILIPCTIMKLLVFFYRFDDNILDLLVINSFKKILDEEDFHTEKAIENYIKKYNIEYSCLLFFPYEKWSDNIYIYYININVIFIFQWWVHTIYVLSKICDCRCGCSSKEKQS